MHSVYFWIEDVSRSAFSLLSNYSIMCVADNDRFGGLRIFKECCA